MYLRFGTINIWPNREEVDKSMPEDFKSKYPKTRVILDCAEPSSLLLNSRLCSSYKSHSERTYWNSPFRSNNIHK